MSKFEVTSTAIIDVKVIKPRVFEDARGYFVETYSSSELAPKGVDPVFVQDNHSLSREVGTLRGLHHQVAPFAQSKLVRCIRGRIWDVVVDIRLSSSTFGRWVATELSAENQLQLFVPVGFAHGFLTLEPDSEVVYKASAGYSAAHEAGVRWDDPAIGIDWPLPMPRPIMSAKDAGLPSLADATVFD